MEYVCRGLEDVGARESRGLPLNVEVVGEISGGKADQRGEFAIDLAYLGR